MSNAGSVLEVMNNADPAETGPVVVNAEAEIAEETTRKAAAKIFMFKLLYRKLLKMKFIDEKERRDEERNNKIEIRLAYG